MSCSFPRLRLIALFMLLAGCAAPITSPIPATEAAQATPPPTTTAVTISKWDLWSDGETMLRGANISQALIIPELDGPTFKGPGPVGPPYEQADFDRLAALGANYVSISGPGIYSIQPPYELLPEVVARYDELLEMIEGADMFATIGFRSGPGRADWSICCADADWAQPYLVDHVWQDREAQAAWSAMWRAAAEHFGGRHNVVAYKLMVEPNAAAFHLGIYDAQEFFASYAGSSYDWNSFFPDIIAAIREADADTPILVSADDSSSLDWLPYVQIADDERTAYFIDQYAPHPYTHQARGEDLTYPGVFDTDYDGARETFDQAWLEDYLSAIDSFRSETGRQVTIEEYGLVRYAPGAAGYLSDVISLFEDKGVNYAIWVWETEWAPYTDEVNEFNWRFGTDPSNTKDEPNELQDVLARFWAANRLRPSGVIWSE